VHVLRVSTLVAVVGCAASVPGTSERPDAAAPALGVLEQLGKSVFFDQRFSLHRNQSCAACHASQVGWSGDRPLVNAGSAVYEGSVSGLFSNRKPPAAAYAMAPVFHAMTEDGEVLFMGGNFWDGRATGERLGDPIAEQAQGPFVKPRGTGAA
jgi:cytochrome c peroxidase